MKKSLNCSGLFPFFWNFADCNSFRNSFSPLSAIILNCCMSTYLKIMQWGKPHNLWRTDMECRIFSWNKVVNGIRLTMTHCEWFPFIGPWWFLKEMGQTPTNSCKWWGKYILVHKIKNELLVSWAGLQDKYLVFSKTYGVCLINQIHKKWWLCWGNSDQGQT